MSEKVKVRTNLAGTRGDTVSFRGKDIKFNDEGVAEVSAEVCNDLIANFPNVYYKDGAPAPSMVSGDERPTPPDPDEDFRSKFEKGESVQSSEMQAKHDEQLAKEREEKEAKDKENEALRKRIEELEAAAASSKDDTEEKEDVEEEKGEEVSEEEKAARAELDGLKVADLKTLIEDTEKFEKKEYDGLKKDELIDFIIDNEIL